jgi:hypothetical protein
MRIRPHSDNELYDSPSLRSGLDVIDLRRAIAPRRKILAVCREAHAADHAVAIVKQASFGRWRSTYLSWNSVWTRLTSSERLTLGFQTANQSLPSCQSPPPCQRSVNTPQGKRERTQARKTKANLRQHASRNRRNGEAACRGRRCGRKGVGRRARASQETPRVRTGTEC